MTDETTTLTAREISNRISGCRTQLKRHAGGARETELRRYLAQLEQARAEQPLRARLAELDARWNELVDTAATGATISKADTAWRNARRRREARKGRYLMTAKEEARHYAETTILALIARHADAAWAQRAQAEIDEAHDLRRQLERQPF